MFKKFRAILASNFFHSIKKIFVIFVNIRVYTKK